MLSQCYIKPDSIRLKPFKFILKDAFEKTDKALVESQLIGFFIDGLYYDFLCMKVMGEGPKTFQRAVQSALAEQNFRKRFNLR